MANRKHKKNHQSKHASAPIGKHSEDAAIAPELEAEIVMDSESIAADEQTTSANARDSIEAEYGGVHEASEVTTAEEEAAQESFRIEFPGSQIVREKAPKVAEVADAIYDQWKKDGDFQGLPLPVNPMAQAAVGLGLRKAKDLEKKLEEKGVFTVAKMGVEFAKMKLEQNADNPILKKIFKK